MEILTTAEVEGKTISVDQTVSFAGDGKFATIKEIFSIEGEVFIAIINHQMPYTLPNTEIQTCRFIMPAKQFILSYGNLL
jgi:hypothetical protein